MKIQLEKVLEYEQPQKYIVATENYSDEYTTPVLTAGKSFILGYTDETDGIYKGTESPVIIFDDFTTASQFVNFPFKVKSSAMKILNVNTELVLPKYIYYRMQIIQFDHDTHKRYWIQQYSKIKVMIPSLDEQKRIVDKIEELFSQIDAGVKVLNQTETKLRLYYQAVLNECIGRDNLRSIQSCIEEMGQGWSPKCERVSVINDDEWAVITTTAVQPGEFIYSENKKLPLNLEPREKHELVVGDVLITRAGPRSRCGVCCMVKKTKRKLINCDKVYRIKVNKEVIYPEYLEMVLNSPAFQKQIAFCKTGGSDSGVNLTQDRFLAIQIPVPALSLQKNIMDEVSKRLSIYNCIENTIESVSIQSEALRLSVLKKAFEGGL